MLSNEAVYFFLLLCTFFLLESHALFFGNFSTPPTFSRVFRDCVVCRRKQGLLDDGTESEVDVALIELFAVVDNEI